MEPQTKTPVPHPLTSRTSDFQLPNEPTPTHDAGVSPPRNSFPALQYQTNPLESHPTARLSRPPQQPSTHHNAPDQTNPTSPLSPWRPTSASRHLGLPLRPNTKQTHLPLWHLLLPLLFTPLTPAAVQIDQQPQSLTATWQADSQTYQCTLSLTPDQPLLSSLTINNKPVATNLDVSYRITTGTRLAKPNTPYIFFDYPISAKNGPVSTHTTSPSRTSPSVKLSDDKSRATITLPGLSAGPFTGPLIITIYDHSPFLHLTASLTPDADNVAYAYEPLIKGPFSSICYLSPTNQFQRDPATLPDHPLKVRHRTILADTPGGSVALFPPPHAFLFPRDYSTNFGFAQAGPNTIGLRNDLSSGNHFVPWADAPKGRAQNMAAFLLFTNQKSEKSLDRVKQYTHNDKFVPLPGHITYISHLHPEITLAEMEGKPTAPVLKQALQDAGINVFHLAEFHGRGHSFDTGEIRLKELKAMFDLCAKYSDEDFLLLPGEEANAYLPGHWLYLLPKPMYITMKPTPGKPPVEIIQPYGAVYHPQNEQEFMQLIADHGGLAWTAHPRIKASEKTPDAFKDRDWYKSPAWLGATWKAMPADLSQPRLGKRSLDLLDDMNTWPGRPKYLPSEIDTFDLDPTHEFYGHANTNYLRLDKVPTLDNYTPILDCLRTGNFFTTTGEVLLHSSKLDKQTLTIDASWTLPLSHAILTTYDGSKLNQQIIPLPHPENQKTTLTLEIPPNIEWYRYELWDIALNGAYTQPTYLQSPAPNP